jgi:hypothetical protein
MGPQQGIGYAHVAEGLRLRAQVVGVGESEREKEGYSRIAKTAAVRRKQNMNENSVPAGVC